MKHAWQRYTLRFKLSAWYAVGGTVLLAGFSATLYFYVAQRMALPLDYYLRHDFAEVQRHLSVTADGRLFWDREEIPRNGEWPQSRPWFELWDESGTLVRRLWPFSADRIPQT